MTHAVALSSMQAARRAGEEATELIGLGLEFRDEEAFGQGIGILSSVLSDAAYILENVEPKVALAGRSRKGMQPALPEERIALLREAVAIDEMAMENLLKARMDISVEEGKFLLDQFYRLLEALRARVQSTKRIIQENWPGFWGEDLNRDFVKYLRKGKRK